jgi:hypothetical protein
MAASRPVVMRSRKARSLMVIGAPCTDIVRATTCSDGATAEGFPPSRQPLVDRTVYHCSGPDKHSWVDPEGAARCCRGHIREPRVSRDETGHAHIEWHWLPIDGADSPASVASAPRGKPVPAPAVPCDVQLGIAHRDGLPHRAFFARLADQSLPPAEFIAHEAGLVTLRLLDRWRAHKAWGRQAPSTAAFVRTRRMIEQVYDHCIADVLRNLTDVIREFAGTNSRSVGMSLLRYGLVLEDLHEWSLAADVYATAVNASRGILGQDGASLLHTRWDHCQRQTSEIDSASDDAHRTG